MNYFENVIIPINQKSICLFLGKKNDIKGKMEQIIKIN